MRCPKTGVGLLLLCLAVPAQAMEETGDPPSFVVRAGLIYTLRLEDESAGKIKDGMMVVKAGRIVGIGPWREPPPNMPVLDFMDCVIIPGLVSAHTHLVPALGGRETISAKYRSLDGFDPYRDHRLALAGGVTSAYLSPGTGRLVSGEGAVVKLAGVLDPDWLLKAGADLCVNLGERVFNPPPLQEYPLPASSDNTIVPARLQRPSTRLSQYLEIMDTFERARAYQADLVKSRTRTVENFDYNLESLADVLDRRPRLRIHAHWEEDLRGAGKLVKELGLEGYVIGALEAHKALDALKASGLRVVLEVPARFNRPGEDWGFGFDEERILKDRMDVSLKTASLLEKEGIYFALSSPSPVEAGDLMLCAAAAVRGGLPPEKALAAITRRPAEILGLGDRIGSLVRGRDADFVVLSGAPLDVRTQVLKVYSSGREVFSYPGTETSLVIRAGWIYTGEGAPLENGELLIEEGKISAVGRSVPHPPGVRQWNAGKNAVVTPGFIDGHGHLGLEGDKSAPGTDVPLFKTVAAAYPDQVRVAACGITTVVTAPYAVSAKGSQVAAIKTAGSQRAHRVVDELAALKFTFRNKDPLLGIDAVRSALKAGKDYADKWNKYFEDLKKWEEAQATKKKESAEEKAVEKEKAPKETLEEEVTEEKKEADPITGTWEFEVAGPPLPEPQKGILKLKLEGGRITGTGEAMFGGDEEVTVEGTLEGTKVFLDIHVVTPMGKPKVEAELMGEDFMEGTVKLGDYFTLKLEARRTAKEAVLVKVARKKKKESDGRPEPPKVNEALEPYRLLLKGEIPALVEVRTAQEIEKIIRVFVEEYKVPLGLLGAEEAHKVMERIKTAGVSVVVPSTVIGEKEGRPYLLADELARAGIPVIFQSRAEDAARFLPLMAGYYVHKGMNALDALAALTIQPARLYRIDDRVGTLEKGKDADLIVFSGEPFEIGSPVLRVYVSGKEVRQP